MAINMSPPANTAPSPEEKLKEDLEGSTDDATAGYFVGADMVNSLEAGVPGYETSGEEGELVGPGDPGFQATGEAAPNDAMEVQNEEENEEEASIAPPTPSP